jgi:thioredoxin 1
MIARILFGILIGGLIGAGLGYVGKCSSGTCPMTANPYRGAVYGAVMGALLVSVFSQIPKKMEDSPNIVHVNNESDFKARVLDANGVCLVELFSDRCPPCRILAPTISSLADKYVGRVIVCKVNVDRVTAIAQRYGVNAIPTVIFFKDGRESGRLVGLQSETKYVAFLDNLIGKDKY